MTKRVPGILAACDSRVGRPSVHLYATTTYPARHTAVRGGLGMALAIQTALRPAPWRYQRGAGKFQLLFSADHQSFGVADPVVAALWWFRK